MKRTFFKIFSIFLFVYFSLCISGANENTFSSSNGCIQNTTYKLVFVSNNFVQAEIYSEGQQKEVSSSGISLMSSSLHKFFLLIGLYERFNPINFDIFLANSDCGNLIRAP